MLTLPDPMLAPLLEALPQGFEFYHLGRIELEARPTHGGDDNIAIAYRIEGELRGLLLLLLDETLDTSVYSEAGNIIASQLVSKLSDQEGLELTLSPPRILSSGQLRALRIQDHEQPHAISRSYVHRHGDRVIHLTAVLLPVTAVPLEGIGNA
jgi:hypothetical protein